MTTAATAAAAGPPAAAAAPAKTPPAAAPEAPADEPRDWAGVALDVAGVVAAGVLVLIVIDVWTEGKLSGWWRARRAAARAAPPGE